MVLQLCHPVAVQKGITPQALTLGLASRGEPRDDVTGVCKVLPQISCWPILHMKLGPKAQVAGLTEP